MDKQQSLLLKKYIDLLFRWKLLLIAFLVCSLPVGLILYLMQPKIYQASSLLSYQQQKISPNKMSPDVQARIKDIVSTLTQIVTSRTNLENLITSFNLYEEKRVKLPMEDVIDLMREDISIVPSRRGDTFSILYLGNEPSKVVKVTNALAAKFIEENLKYREERATETSSYTSNELEMAKSTMDRKEAAMRDYKLKYYNEMPDQRESNVSRLIALQEQYQGKQESILELERTRVLVQEQIALREKVLAAEADAARSALESVGISTVDSQINQPDDVKYLLLLRAELEKLLIKYTENHPDVKRLKKKILQLEQKVPEDLTEAGTGVKKKATKGRLAKGISVDEEILQLQMQRRNVEQTLAAIEAEKAQLKEKIEEYENWVAAAPVREAEWAALTREYGELKRHYDYLVAQDLQAKSMLNLERRQKGSQFKVEDPARMPEKPIKPDFLKTMVVSVGGTLVLGFGFILLVSFMDTSFRDPDDLENFIGVPVVSTITYFETVKEKRFRIIKTIAIVIVIVALAIAVLGLFWYAWSKGKIVI